MAKWYVHLGFQWGSPLIGSVWNLGHESDEYRFLQYALSQDQAGHTPAWFNFQVGDVLYFFIWNLGQPSSPPTPSTFNLGFSYLDSAATYDPSTFVNLPNPDAWSEQQTANGSSYLQNKSFSDSAPSNCPWGSYGSSYTVTGAVQFQASVTGKLSFYLEVDSGSDSQTFISDPEVIIGPNGNPS
ncbi:MAG TPA: hypothetical protein VH165_06105 [Kofleriaceae bacterium]|jgi:hypothetical protein|nr:hypothetical protein [Kofleriaceae bacterium]